MKNIRPESALLSRISSVLESPVLYLLMLFCLQVNGAHSQCIDTVDLTLWFEPAQIQVNWVADGPHTVTQEVEIFPPMPSFYVSDQEYINVKISFDVVSNYAGDDDFIGFVAGYRNPFSSGSNQYEFVLFDWKARKETAFGLEAHEGYSLLDFHGYIAPNLIPAYFWNHYGYTGNTVFSPLARKEGDNLGWETGRTYHVEAWYTTASVIIDIDGIRVFTVDRCNQPGRIGFYTYSQYRVTFSNLTISQAADLQVFPEEICAGDPVTASIEDTLCQGYNPAMVSWSWDWGDGTVDQDLVRGEHIFQNAGNYAVTMLAIFSNGCTDTVVRTVNVKENPPVDLGPDTLVPIYSTITLVAGPELYGWSYLWSDGSLRNSLTLAELDRDTLVGVAVTKGDCMSYDEIYIQVSVEQPPEPVLWVPNAFSPDGDGLNDFFLPLIHEQPQGEYRMYIYNRWGAELFSSRDPFSGWDGRFKGQDCPADVYVYLVLILPSVGGQKGSEMTWRGNLLLVR